MNNEKLIKLPKQVEELTSQMDNMANLIINYAGNNDTEKIKNCLSDSENKIVYLEKGKVYTFTDKIQLPKGCKIKGNGAIINFACDVENFLMNDNTSIEDLTINQLGSVVGGNNGQYQAPIGVGEYNNTVSYSNVTIKNITINTERINGNGIFVTGRSNNVIIENITFSDNDKIGRPILIHWGNYLDRHTLTTHPHNITVKNIKIGKMGLAVGDASGIFVSGSYNIDIDNVFIEETNGRGITVYPGDCGFENADDIQKPNAYKNITIKNVSISKSNHRGFHVYFKSSTGEATPEEYETGIVFENCSTNGSNLSNVSNGFFVEYVNNVKFINCSATNHANGFVTGQKCRNILVSGGSYYNNQCSGVYIGNNVEQALDCKVDGITAYNNGTNTNAEHRGGVTFSYSTNCSVINCLLGKNLESTQLYGVQFVTKVGLKPNNIKLLNNHVLGVANGGIAYSIHSIGYNYNYDINLNNTCASGLTYTNTGGINFSSINPQGNKIIYMGNKPTTLVWTKGDIVYNTNPTNGAYLGWVCTVSGEARNTDVLYNWATNIAYNVGVERQSNGNIYLSKTSGTSGATPPSHTSGAISDGGVIWEYVNKLAHIKGFGLIES